MQAIEVGWFGGFDRADVADARVVDEDVQMTDGFDCGSDRVGTGDVEMQCLCRAEGLGESFGGGEIDVGDPDGSAGARQFLYCCFANAAGAAGNKSVTAIEAERVVRRDLSAHEK